MGSSLQDTGDLRQHPGAETADLLDRTIIQQQLEQQDQFSEQNENMDDVNQLYQSVEGHPN